MRLKSIEIQGFKSFPDRTVLEFDQGVTAVIGPNGSGKSNIADAMRWVLGEQSTKTLRGGKMEDVIFGGTQSRKAQGAATVTLVIDNRDRSLPFDADEVSVSRRLYRSGDSEYRINGAMVRLRDVNELFMDTGLGRDGYSIIGQGRVAEIVSARSKERREIFEEAAGISKFRYRKTEAERRLALAEDNLLRLRDILSELESRVGPLKAQSEKAARFLEYAGEKKELEISLSVRTLSQLHQRIAALEDKLLLAQNDHTAAQKAAADCEAGFSREMEKARLLMAEIERLRSEADDLTEQASSAQSAAAVEKNNIQHYEDAVQKEEEALDLSDRSQEEAAAAIAACKSACEEKEAQQSEEKRAYDLLAEEIGRQEHALALSDEAGDALRKRRAAAFEAIDAARLDAATSATVLGESEERLAAMADSRRREEEALANAQREREECVSLLSEIASSLTSLENSAGGYLLKRQSRQQKLDALREKQEALSREINLKKQRARVLSDMDKNMEGFGASVRFVLAKASAGVLGGVRGPVSSLIRVDAEYTTAIETALGAAIQNIVVENEDAAKRAIRLLQQEKAGRATFLPLTSVHGQKADTRQAETIYGYVGLASELVEYDREYEGILTSLLGRTVVAETLDAAVVIAKKNGYRFRIVTLDGQVVNAGGSMTGGFASRSAGVIGRKKEIDDLLAKAASLEKNAALLEEEAGRYLREIASVDAEVEAIEAQKKTCLEDKFRAETTLSHLEQEISLAQKKRGEADAERERLLARIEEMRSRSLSSEELSRTLTGQLDALQQEIASSADRSREISGTLLSLRKQLSEKDTSLALLGQKISGMKEEYARLVNSQNAGKEKKAAHLAGIEELRGRIREANLRVEQLLCQKDECLQKAKCCREDAGARMQERDACEQRTSQLRADEKEASARRDTLYREVVRLTEQKTSAEGEKTSLVNRLYDEYELTLTAAEELAKPIEDAPAASRRLAELRAKIKALGSVNVDAIDEYRDVLARYQELEKQLADVEKSKTELSRLIRELTGQMCEIFAEKFAAIDQNFQTIFSQLFDGGTASLSLTDPDDLLESGIEISVHPPGKLIRNLASLSGGEQSFVAIAIFFSILRVNPSPFCLMDEIEAALDDVNVAKFAAYLHHLTDKTQFITITHRRGTMEEADVLYGVTMQEEGVSKLLRLQVSEIERTLQTKNAKQEG